MKNNISLNMFSLFLIMFTFGCQSEVEATSDQTLDQSSDVASASSVSYTHLTLPTNREV